MCRCLQKTWVVETKEEGCSKELNPSGFDGFKTADIEGIDDLKKLKKKYTNFNR